VLLPELETARLSVRLARPGMERAMAAFFVANFPGHLDRWSPPVTRAFFTEAFWSERLALALQEFEGDRAVRFVIQPRGPADGAIIGTANYTNIARGAFQACHLGYQVAADHEGRGFMAEALRATNRFMFETLHLHRIMANFLPHNERSRRLAARLGFVEEGLAPRYLFIDGAWRDHVLTALVNPDFDDDLMRPREG
jgi:[ribosomal protein S5]-alanine N-acetyltransferase